MRTFAGLAVLSLASLALAGCESSPPKSPAVANAKALTPPKYTPTGTRLATDHPESQPGLGVMSQGALQDAIGDHTGPGYNQDVPSPQ